jgi:hypothetical protein
MTVDDAVKAYCELLRISLGSWARFQAEPAMIFLRDYIAEETDHDAEVVQVACEEAAASANDEGGVYTRFGSPAPDFISVLTRLSPVR